MANQTLTKENLQCFCGIITSAAVGIWPQEATQAKREVSTLFKDWVLLREPNYKIGWLKVMAKSWWLPIREKELRSLPFYESLASDYACSVF